MPTYRYTTKAPNPRTSYLHIQSLPGHSFGLKKRRDIEDSKNHIYYQVYCSCKWRDPTWYAIVRQWENSYNDHILEMSRQGRFNVEA